MARRRGRPGDYLMSDDYTGAVCYASELKRDPWGAYAKKPLLRNMQEIASPLDDPAPVPIFRGPSYETYSTPCIGKIAPLYVGLTTVPTNPNNAAFQALTLNPGIGDMEIGCTFFVRGDPPAWNISLASYDNKSFNFSAQSFEYVNLTIRPNDGNFYIGGGTSHAAYQYSMTASDISTGSYLSKTYDFLSQTNLTNWVIFNDDGTKMYSGGSGNGIYQYTITGWDVTTAVYDGVLFDDTAQSTMIYGIFNGDGTKLFLGGSDNIIYQYSVLTPYDLSTASYDSVTFDPTPEDNSVLGIAFNSDGDKMFLLGSEVTSIVFEYDLTPDDISTATYSSISYDASAEDTLMTSMAFNSDGTKMYLGSYTGTLYQYSTA